MKKTSFIIKSLALVVCLLCSLSAAAAEAYACYTSSNTTLTFYYDNLRSSRSGTTYDLNTGASYPTWRSKAQAITQVVFDPSFAGARPTTTYGWFSNMYNLATITNLSNLNTSQVTIMAHMFYQCRALTTLDLSSFNTSQVERMDFMFDECSSLTSLDLSSFYTANVFDMTKMFYSCNELTSIFASSKWKTYNVTSSLSMFYKCYKIRGGMGTTYDANHVDKDYAHIDGGPDNPGYFTTLTDNQAYACYTPSNTTLTFYYDRLRNTRTGMTYDLNTSNNDPAWYTDSTYLSVTQVVFDPSFADARPTSTYAWFGGMTNLTSITGMREYLNTSEVTTMYIMFARCEKLSSLDLGSFNTANVIDMRFMFNGCSGLTSLNVSGFNTANVIGMRSMFHGCSSLTSLDLSSFNTAQVTDMAWMFYGCSALRSVNLSSFNTANVTTMYYMFQGCSSLTSLDLSGFNTGNVNNMGGMFEGCNSLTSLDLSGFNTSNVTLMGGMFRNCSSLTAIDLSSFNTSNVVNMQAMFQGCSSLTSLDLSGFNTANMTAMSNMFRDCSNLVTIYVGRGWNTEDGLYVFLNCFNLVGGMGTTYYLDGDALYDGSYAHVDGGPDNYPGLFTAVTEAYACFTETNGTLAFYCDDQWYLRTGVTYDLNTGSNYPDWLVDIKDNCTKVVFHPSFASARPTTTYCWFFGMSELQTIEGINYLNTSNVTDMTGMFMLCEELTSLDVSSFNTAKVTSMESMFSSCSRLTSLNVSLFNTSNVTNMESMFQACQGLTNLDVSNFNTAKVTNMTAMFGGCSRLTSLNVSSFNTANVTDMSWMFFSCTELTNLDISSFNTSKVYNMNYMFSRSSKLSTIYVGSGWTTAAVTYSIEMFNDCTSLVGGMGTTYDANHVDKAYAHIDGGTSNPGYLTDITPKPYACFTPSNMTFTFYYDNQRGTRTGTIYDLNTTESFPGWNDISPIIGRVVFDPSFADARPQSTVGWFYEMESVESVTGMEYLNTSEVTSMAMMFGFCNLTSLDLSHFNTSSVTNMSGMFAHSYGLTALDLSNFNTANVRNMSYMFTSCHNLATINVGSGWSTAAVTNSSDMFYDCTSLVGGMGTTYNANHVDKTYAHIDGGPSNPGYLTSGRLKGDVNHDGKIDVTDVTLLISYVLNNVTLDPNEMPVADMNNDGRLDVTDVTMLISVVLNQV